MLIVWYYVICPFINLVSLLYYTLDLLLLSPLKHKVIAQSCMHDSIINFTNNNPIHCVVCLCRTRTHIAYHLYNTHNEFIQLLSRHKHGVSPCCFFLPTTHHPHK